MKDFFSLIYGFLLKEFYIEKSYKLSFLFKVITTIFQLLIFYFLCKIISSDYFKFLFIGILFSRSMHYTFTSLNEVIRQEQHWGTIETLVLLPYNEITIFISAVIAKYIFLYFEIIFYLIIASFLGANFNIFQVIIIYLVLTFFNILFLCFGLLISSATLLTRKMESLSWLVLSLIDLLSGVYFSPTQLPQILYKISLLLPTTTALSFFRSTMDKNLPLGLNSLLTSILWSLLFYPIAIFLFSFVLKTSLRKGSLENY